MPASVIALYNLAGRSARPLCGWRMEEVLRKRLAVLVAAAMVLVMAASPAWAAKGGFPTEGTCGLGKSEAQEGIADQSAPGASEFARLPPSEAGCTGNG